MSIVKKVVRGFYFWLLVAIVVPFAMVSVVNIGGLGWVIYKDEPDFTIDILLMLLFFVQIIIANRVFGIKGGIISSFGLGALITLQVINNSRNEDYFIVIAGVIGIGICASLLLDRQEKERRLISQQAEERCRQTVELNQEILERKRTEEENEILLQAYKQQNSLIIKSNIELEEVLSLLVKKSTGLMVSVPFLATENSKAQPELSGLVCIFSFLKQPYIFWLNFWL